MTEQLQKFNEARDEAIKGLERCDVLMMDDEIEGLGYSRISLKSANTGRDEHELAVYGKEDKRMVFIQTYSEREGGLYFQSLFTDKETVDELEKPLVLASLSKPSTFLIETILHFKGILIPGTDRLFPDMSIYMGCHHYVKIYDDPAMAELAISNYKKMIPEPGAPGDRNMDDRRKLIWKAIHWPDNLH